MTLKQERLIEIRQEIIKAIAENDYEKEHKLLTRYRDISNIEPVPDIEPTLEDVNKLFNNKGAMKCKTVIQKKKT